MTGLLRCCWIRRKRFRDLRAGGGSSGRRSGVRRRATPSRCGRACGTGWLRSDGAVRCRSSAFEVGDGARYFQDAVVGARGKPQARDGSFQQFLAVGGDRAVLANQLRRHLRVGIDALFAGEALELPSAARAPRARAPRPNLRSLRRRAAPCISPPALRCEYPCGRAAARKFSRRSAGSAAACSGIRAWDRRKIRTGTDSSPPPA